MRTEQVKKLSDEELVTRVRQSNQELYVEVVRRYQAPLFRYAVTLVHDVDIAQDIVQDALIKAFTNLRSFNTKKKFSSWLYRITHNQAMDHFRSQRRFTSFDLLPELVQTLVSKSNVEVTLDETLLREKIDEVIDQLPLQYRTVVILYYLEGKKYAEISEVMKVPEGTVATWLRRSKVVLAKALKEYEPKKKPHDKQN